MGLKDGAASIHLEAQELYIQMRSVHNVFLVSEHNIQLCLS